MAFVFGAFLLVGVVVRIQGNFGSSIVIAVGLMLLAVILPRSIGLLAAAALVGFGVGMVFANGGGRVPAGSDAFAHQTEIAGTIESDPRLATSGLTARLSWQMSDGSQLESLLIYSPAVDLGRGDRVRASGEWLNSSSELFVVDAVEILDTAGGIEQLRQRLRAAASSNVLRRTPGSNGSLALGLIIGDDSGLTAEERDDMRASGLSHITAVSGSNVALVIVAVGYLLRALNRRGWLWLLAQLAGVSGYVWIVGADPPIVRAAIMGSLALVAGGIGRPSHLYTLLFLAGGLMCIHDPAVLSSLAFQLSFTSMIGLALAGDLITRATGTRRKVIAALMSPAGAALLTAPLIAGRFGTFSPATVPANIMIAPLVGPATALAGMVAVVPGWFFIGEGLGMVLWILAGAVLKISATIGAMPFAVISFAPLSNAQILGLYAVLAAATAPLVPEMRLLEFRLRGWVSREPGLALTCLTAGLAMVSALVFAVD